MAYIKKEQAAAVRAELKKKFPKVRFSVRIEHYSTLHISIMESPYDWSSVARYKDGHVKLSWRSPKDYPHSQFLEQIIEIAMRGNWDKSDSMTDYFNVGWYFDLEVGRWDRPHIQKGVAQTQQVPVQLPAPVPVMDNGVRVGSLRLKHLKIGKV